MQGKQPEVFKAEITIPQFYEFFARRWFKTRIKKNYRIDKTNAFFITKKQYAEVLKDFNKEIRNLLLYEAYEYKIPCNLGRISIQKKKVVPTFENGVLINPMPIDRKGTKELWIKHPEFKNIKYMYHTNEHSDGFVAKFYYKKNFAKFVGKGKYFAKATRTIKEKINEIMTAKFKEHDFFLIN